MQLQLRGSLREGASHARPAWIFRSTTSRCTSFISGHRYNRRHWRKWTRVRSKVQRNSAKLFQWFAFCGASGAGNEVSHAFLSPRIMEWIIQVLGSVSRGVMEKHAPNAGEPLENRANKGSPYPQSRVERRPDRLSHPERLSHCSQNGWRELGSLRAIHRHLAGCGRGAS